MSVFKYMKKIFGIGDEAMSEEWSKEYDATAVQQLPKPHETSSSLSELNVDSTMVQNIFGCVVEVFNAALPDFLQKSADPQKQSQYLYDALDASVKEYLESLKKASREACQNAWEGDKEQMLKQMETLQKRVSELEEKKSKISERQLSADRQKRALQERVHDLEEQVMGLEAEKEQYQLEAQSLLNKIKVSGVRETDIEQLQAENEQLKKQIEQGLSANGNEAEERAKAAELKVTELESELKKINDAIEAAKVKNQMADEMVAEMRKMLAAKEEEMQQKLAEAQQQAQAQLPPAEDTVATKEEIEAIMAQVSRFEEVKTKMNNRIESLKDSLKESQKVIESLRSTIQANSIKHAEEQKALRAQIADLQSQSTRVEMVLEDTEQTNSNPEIDQTDNDLLDDPLLSGDDWLVSRPDKESSMRPPSDEVEFGYQAPAKKHRASENKQQMSLFD